MIADTFRYASYFDFNGVRAGNDPSWFPCSSSLMRALRIRGSVK